MQVVVTKVLVSLSALYLRGYESSTTHAICGFFLDSSLGLNATFHLQHSKMTYLNLSYRDQSIGRGSSFWLGVESRMSLSSGSII